MKLKNLIKDISFEGIKGSKEILITGLCSNSKLVVPGNLFIARKGKIHDGSKFIEEAINTGAVAILTDMYNPFLSHITQLIDQDIVSKEISLAARFYQEPSKKLFLVGITGTNGKTTISYLTRHLFGETSCGLIGGVECIIGEQHFPSTLTTPDVIFIHKTLRDMVTRHLSSAVMEVSSHALDQQRVGGLDFDVAIFTNLSQDHLDYHLTMDEYAIAKAKLFASLEKNRAAVINSDCSYSSIMQEATHAHVLTYGMNKPANLFAHDVIFSRNGTRFSLRYQDKDYLVETNLIGRFNVYNTLAAIGAALCKGLSMDQILLRVRSFVMTKGRLELVCNPLNLSIYVDYAVTPDALHNVLVTMKELTKGKLYVVFGCGGNRDQTKRPKMGRIAALEADHVIITSDNPRMEEPAKIAQAILEGVLDPEKVEVILDRKEAIEAALERILPEDVLIIAGKGHEKKQIFSDRIIDFDDKEVVLQLLSSKSFTKKRS